jgi:hypothetical protein
MAFKIDKLEKLNHITDPRKAFSTLPTNFRKFKEIFPKKSYTNFKNLFKKNMISDNTSLSKPPQRQAFYSNTVNLRLAEFSDILRNFHIYYSFLDWPTRNRFEE